MTRHQTYRPFPSRSHTYGVRPWSSSAIATEPCRPTACVRERPCSHNGEGGSAPYSSFYIHHSSLSFTFSAKERDSETGLSYFGSRYYSSDLSIWLSVDPMSDKYPSLSPYTYCANNPVKLVDPNGETIVGTDDNAVSYTYDEQGNVVWSKNTSADAMRIGNAMLKTETGKEQLDKLIASQTRVTFQIADRNEKPSVMGDSQYKSPISYDGIEPPSSATIIIYEGSIKDYLSSYEIKDGTLNMGTYWASQDIANGVDNYIAAVAGHEAEHIVSRENRIISAICRNNPTEYNLWLRELVPDIKKTRILWETYLK